MADPGPRSGIAYRRIGPEDAAAFAGLYAIYLDVFPASERKSRERLWEMLNTDANVFIVGEAGGEAGGEVLCFAIARVLEGAGAALLEYMGVRRDAQGRGAGARTFGAVASQPSLAGRVILLEVEDHRGRDPAGEEARRKAFYRKLGCREVAGLAYLMPPVSEAAPPPLNILAHGAPASPVSKATLTGWLQAIYAQVYNRSEADPAIAAMVAPLPAEIALV